MAFPDLQNKSIFIMTNVLMKGKVFKQYGINCLKVMVFSELYRQSGALKCVIFELLKFKNN